MKQRCGIYALAIATIVVAAACANSKKFTSIRIVYDKDAQIRPGGTVPFGVVANHKNGDKILTKGYLKGKYHINNYHIEAEGGWVDGATLFVDTTEDRNVNRSVRLYAYPVKKPSLLDSIDIPMTYEGLITWNFSGENGEDGDSKSRRIIPIRIGGTGLQTGKPGDTGSSGTDAQDIQLYVFKIHDDSFYRRNGFDVFAVMAKTETGSYYQFTYIAEKYGRLVVKSNGGNGGRGGNGGAGTNGSDSDGKSYGGSGTAGGNGGDGGRGGRGGKITVYIDEEAKDFEKYLEIQNRGGNGGIGGAGGRGGTGGRNPDGSYERNGATGRPGSNGFKGEDGGAPSIRYQYVRF